MIETHTQPTEASQEGKFPLDHLAGLAQSATVRRVPFADQRPDALPAQQRVGPRHRGAPGRPRPPSAYRHDVRACRHRRQIDHQRNDFPDVVPTGPRDSNLQRGDVAFDQQMLFMPSLRRSEGFEQISSPPPPPSSLGRSSQTMPE